MQKKKVNIGHLTKFRKPREKSESALHRKFDNMMKKDVLLERKKLMKHIKGSDVPYEEWIMMLLEVCEDIYYQLVEGVKFEGFLISHAQYELEKNEKQSILHDKTVSQRNGVA